MAPLETSFPRQRIWLGAAGAGALATILFLALLLKDPALCWNDDYALSILPVFADVARAWHEGVWPLLSPYSWECANLAGEYQYGTFSVFVNATVAAVFAFHPSYPNAAAMISAAHLFVLAAGAYVLAARRGMSPPTATAVALTGALNGWIVCWGATDWFGALAAMAWLPWAWWALEISLDRSAPRWRWILPAPFIYLLVSGGFPYTVVVLGVTTVWIAARERALAPLAVGWTLGLGLAAPAWLSLLTYMHGSGRALGEDVHHNGWVVPFQALPGFILPCWVTSWPDFAGKPMPHAAIEMAGALFFIAALCAAAFLKWPRLLRWDLALAIILLAGCMSPTAGVFRWSFRLLPSFHLALAVAGGQALELARRRSPRWRLNPGLWATGLSVLTWLALPAMRVGGERPSGTTALPLATVIFALLWMIAERRHALRWAPAAIAVSFLFSAFLALPVNPGVPRYPLTGNLDYPAPLSTGRLYLSLYLPPDQFYHGNLVPPGFGTVLRLGSTGLFAGVHLINGYSPVHPAGIGRLLDLETHGQIPPERAAEALQPGNDLLDQLGVDGLIVARGYPLPSGLPAPEIWGTPVFNSDEGKVYHRRTAFTAIRAENASTQVRLVSDTRLRIEAEVQSPQPARLSFRRPFFPGYHATLNGRALPVGCYKGLFPTIDLPAGSAGRVVLFYRPLALTLGMFITAVSAAGIALFAGWPALRARFSA